MDQHIPSDEVLQMTAQARSSSRAVPESLTIYLDEIGRHPLLAQEDERELGRRIRAGDLAAVDLLVCSNLRFVVAIARQHRNRGVRMADLITEGNLSLLRAARRFDERKFTRFLPYAMWWVREAMLRTIGTSEQGIHAPQRRSATSARSRDEPGALTQELREPTSADLAGRLQGRAELGANL